MTDIFDQGGVATAKLIFAGERFVCLPRIAEMMQNALDCALPPRLEDVTLTSILVDTDDEAVLMDLAFEGDETVLTLGLRLPQGDDRAPPAVLAKACHYLARNLPIAFIVWGAKGPRIPRNQFVESLDDCFPRKAQAIVTQITPRRVSPIVTRSPTNDVVEVKEQIVERLYTSDITALREGDERMDAHVMAYEEHLKDQLRANLKAEVEQSTASRLTAWAASLSAATIAFPVALPSLAYNAMRREDVRSSANTLAIAGTYVAINQSGVLAAIF